MDAVKVALPTCALAQAPTLELLQQRAGELAERLRAGERGVLRAGDAGALRAGWGLDELATLERVASGALRPPRPRSAPPSLAFLYPGQGAQRAGAAAWWSARPAFAQALERAGHALDSQLSRPLRELLTAEDAALDATAVTQPVLVAFALALTAQWRAWGVEPTWVLGHSLGELAAASAAGCCSEAEALGFAFARGRAMQRLEGGMAAVFAPPAQVEALLTDLGAEAWLAADNGPRDSVIAGSPAAVERALRLATLEGLEVRPLAVSFAAHGPAVDPAVETIANAAESIAWRAPRCGWVSTHAGLERKAAPSAEFWRAHTREPVRYGPALQALRAAGSELTLELGPGASLTRLAAQVFPEGSCLTSAPGDADPAQHVLNVCARLWERGIPIDWDQVFTDIT